MLYAYLIYLSQAGNSLCSVWTLSSACDDRCSHFAFGSSSPLFSRQLNATITCRFIPRIETLHSAHKNRSLREVHYASNRIKNELKNYSFAYSRSTTITKEREFRSYLHARRTQINFSIGGVIYSRAALCMAFRLPLRLDSIQVLGLLRVRRRTARNSKEL